MPVFQGVLNQFCFMDKNYILAFEDSPFVSINFRIGDTVKEAQKLDQETRRE